MRLIWLFLILTSVFPLFSQDNTWEWAQETGTAELDLIWFTSNPFIRRSADGNLTGAEYELMVSFKKYLKEKRGVDLTLNWQEADSFSDIIDKVQSSSKPNVFGVSAFSITEDRKKILQFTDPYLPDITVLVSSKGTPIVRTYEEINSMMSGLQAVTIEGTTYEGFLKDLKMQLGVDFEILQIGSDENVLDYISQVDNRFGFIDLPIYLMWVQNGSEVVRQNFFTVRGIGYGFILPKHSDWSEPYNAFLADSHFRPEAAKIISKFIGAELYEFIDDTYEDDQIGSSILTKEKELQLALLQNANLRLERGEAFQQALIIGIIVSLVFLGTIGVLFYNNQKVTKQLLAQKKQIEEHQEDIQQKNEQLLNRNAQLIGLNEEKNYLMNVLAHDLRGPLSNIIGLISIYKESAKEEDGVNPMEMINDQSLKIKELINKILDVKAIESGRSAVLNETVNLEEMIGEIIARHKPIAAAKAIEFRVTKRLEILTLETDHLLLYMVLDNLISNAIKFSNKDSLVEMTVKSIESEVLFELKDQGPGFTESDKKKMFRRFQTLTAKPTANEPSTGLGLSIVKKYVTELGGELWLESERGEGSTFYVKLST